jgi:hypothetical protein
MAACTLGGVPILRCDVVIPRSGLLHGDVQLQAAAAPARGSTATLVLGTVSRQVYIEDSGAPYQQPRCRIGAGAGKLTAGAVNAVLLEPSDYQQVGLDVVARDILTQAGEQVGDLSALQAYVVPQWQISAERPIAALQRVLRQPNLQAYAQRQAPPILDLWCEHDGRISVRQTTWAQTFATTQVRGAKPQERQIVLMMDDSAVEPGIQVQTQFGSFNAERVQYLLDPQDARSQLTCRVWYTQT